jgi:GNAT superfamily N-acetyltransferase
VSVLVRPAGAADIDGVCELLHTHMSAKISMARWRGLLDYPWRPADADRGIVAIDAGRVVGFLGLVYADRPIDGRTERFCNICAWYLIKDYRGRGIGQAIQREAISDPSRTYTLVTATAGTDRAFRGSGFQVLDAERYLLSRSGGSGAGLDHWEGVEAIEALLEPAERAVLHDHRGFNLRHLLFHRGGRACYVVMQVKLKGDAIAYHEVLHASDQGFLNAHAQAIADRLLPDDRSVFAVDKRLIDHQPGAEIERLRQPRLFASPRVPPAAIDHLYNEIVLLDLKLP